MKANDFGTGHGTAVSNERYVWMVWGALVLAVSQDAGKPIEPASFIRDRIAEFCKDEIMAKLAIGVIRAAKPYERASDCLIALEEYAKSSVGMKRARRDTDPAPKPPEGCERG